MRERAVLCAWIVLIFFSGMATGYFLRGALSEQHRAPPGGAVSTLPLQHHVSPREPALPSSALQGSPHPSGALHLPAPRVPPAERRNSPPARVAVIIDDLGGSLDQGRKLISLPFPLTLSVLPGLPHSREIALESKKGGKQVLLHLPMEAMEHNRLLGHGAILTAMTEIQIRGTVEADLAWVPGAEGINNHMGSKACEDARVVTEVLEVARERRLFFIDSLTSPSSIIAPVAEEMGVRNARREVFLDNVDTQEYVEQQVQELVTFALRRGEAIAIGHPKESTMKVLLRLPQLLEKYKVQIVPAGDLVKPQ